MCLLVQALRKAQNADEKTHVETKENQILTIQHRRTVQVSEVKLFDILPVTLVMITTKANGLLYFHPDQISSPEGACLQKALVKLSVKVHHIYSHH